MLTYVYTYTHAACPSWHAQAKELKAMSIAEEKEMLELESLIDEHGLTGRAVTSDHRDSISCPFVRSP